MLAGLEKETMTKPEKSNLRGRGKRVQRNVFCKKYSDCLNKCIERQSIDFDCAGCQDYEKINISLQDVIGSFLLLARLYLPEAYQQYQDFITRELFRKKEGQKMMQTAVDLKVLTKDEQHEAYEKAKGELEKQDLEWRAEQKKFLDENPEYRDNPDLNDALVSEVNRLIMTERGMRMTNRQVLESAYVNIHLSYNHHDPRHLH